MNRDDCEKLLDAFENATIATRLGTSESIPLAKAARDSLHDVIVGIMADEKKPAYRGGGFTVRNVPLTIPPNVSDNKPIVTPLTVETDVANMPSIPNMNSLLCEHEEK